MLSTIIPLATALIALAAWFFLPRRSSLPPGPPGLPILGNLLQVPHEFSFLQFHAWSKQYGGCYSLNLAGQRGVILASVKAAADILDRTSGPTAGRPQWIKLNQFLSRGNNIVGAQQGETWRRLRRATHEVLNVRSVTGFQPMQEQEAAITLLNLLKRPDVPLEKHFHRASASIVWRALYGGQPLPLDNHGPSERIEEMATYIFKAAVPGGSLMDLIPPLRHVYAASKWLRKSLDDWYEETSGIFLDIFKDSNSAEVFGNPCVSNNLSKLPDDYGIGETTKAWASGVLFTAGQDTTAGTLRFFALAMLLYPDVARRAHKELDEVVGDRLPTFADKHRVPYILAIVKEVLRWRPVAPLGVPHAASEDIEYNGYVIPKGAWLIDNIWSQTRDPEVYDHPDTFDPSRFLDAQGTLKHGMSDTHDDGLGFGHGRRVCPGRDLAQNSLFISFACLLWAFEFHPRKVADGKEAKVDSMNLIDNFITVQPAPFEVDLIPRFEDLGAKLSTCLHSVS